MRSHKKEHEKKNKFSSIKFLVVRNVIFMTMGGLIAVVSLLLYHRITDLKKATDSRLFTIAEMSREMLGSDYHDQIVDAFSVADEDFKEIMDRNDDLSRRLGVQYIWSVLVVDDAIVFTSATRSDLNDKDSAHASFFEVHADPDVFSLAISQMKPTYTSFKNEWGEGRMVLVPRKDQWGRVYIFGASLQMRDYQIILLQTILQTLFAGMLFILFGFFIFSWAMKTLTKPITELTKTAREISKGNFDIIFPASKVEEIYSLSLSLDCMKEELKKRMDLLESENQIFKLFETKKDSQIIFDHICLHGEKLDTAIKASILLVDDEKESLYFSSGPSLPDDYNAILKPPGIRISEKIGSCGTAAFTKELVVVTDIQNDSKWTPFADLIQKTQENNLRACWSLPILSTQGELLGTIANYSTKKGKPTEQNLKILEWSAYMARLVIERERTEKALIQAKEKAESSNVAKSQFLSNMSHEIRTPLNGIHGFLHLLKNSNLDTDQLNYVQYINHSAEILVSLANNVLDLSKIEAGGLVLEKSNLNINKVIHDTVYSFIPQSKEKGIHLILSMEDTISENVIGDVVKIKQILNNLIGNAIKFTLNGSVTINVKKIKVEDKDITIEFRISDTGIGISKENIEKLFKPFTQADSSITRKFGGTGLGLSITKKIIEAMNGTIRIESEEGIGTRFVFHLVLERNERKLLPIKNRGALEEAGDRNPDDFKNKDSTENVRDRKGNKLNILTVEDNLLNAKFMKRLLENNGYSTDVVEDGLKAVEAVLKKDYDIIFMDCQMPVMNGYEATQEIRKLGISAKIVALTANVMKADIDQCFDSGMDDYLSKPIHVQKLLSLIEQHRPMQKNV
jgi:signal transduction histidine kinase/ActR/RegA family two-component response regulator/HAMP domain-containing protein